MPAFHVDAASGLPTPTPTPTLTPTTTPTPALTSTRASTRCHGYSNRSLAILARSRGQRDVRDTFY